MFYVIRLYILHYALPKSIFHWKVCYIYFWWSIYSSTAPELYMGLYWYVFASFNGVCIDMFVHTIIVSLLLYMCMLYNIIVVYTSSWYFSIYCEWVIPPLRHCYICFCVNMFWMLYLWLLKYVCVHHMIVSLVALHIGNIGMHISCIIFVVPLLPY